MNGLRADRKRYRLIELQVSWPRQANGHALAVEVRSDNPRFSFEREIAIMAGPPLHKTRKAPRAIAAHFTGAAITIIELPGPIRLPRMARNQQNDTIGANTAMAITQPHDLVALQFNRLLAIIDEHKIIARAIHLGEFQNHP